MTLNEFINICSAREKYIVYLCSDEDYDEMFVLIDEINDGEKEIEDIGEYIICAFIPHCGLFTTACYLKNKLADAKVEHFYAGDGYMIVWIDEGKSSFKPF